MAITVLLNLAITALLAAVALLAGVGLLAAFGVQQDSRRVYLAPTVFLSTLSLVLVVPVLLGIPLKSIALGIWLLVGSCLTLGVLSLRRNRISREEVKILSWAFVVTALLLVGFELHGMFDYLGSPNQDGLTYVAFAEYIREYARGTEGGLAPLYQYASHLSASRFVGSAMLATFVPPGASHVDAQMMVGPLFVFAIFAFATAVAYAATGLAANGLRTPAIQSVVVAVLGGWFAFPMFANNFDNFVVLATAPALYGVAIDPGLIGRARWIVPSVLIGAAFYIFPEISVLFAASYFVVGVDRWKAVGWRQQLWLWVPICVMVLVLAAPNIKFTIGFIQGQLAITQNASGPRPGNGLFPDLLVAKNLLGAFWGFRSGNTWLPNAVLITNLLGGGFAICSLAGLAAAIRAKRYSIALLAGGTAILSFFMILQKRYDYGGYKILLEGWWVFALLLVAGVNYLRENKTHRLARGSGNVLALLLVFGLGIYGMQQIQLMGSYQHKDARVLRAASDRVASFKGDASVNVSDPILSGWMVFLLRDSPVHFDQFNGYMAQAHVVPVLARSNMPATGGDYVLVDNGALASGMPVWKNREFQMLHQDGSVMLAAIGQIEAPNGVEKVDGDTFFWLDNRVAKLEIQSASAGTVILESVLIGGTSVADPGKLLGVEVRSNGEVVAELDVSKGPNFPVRIPVDQGLNTVTLKADYDGPLASNPNGDPRTLLVGFKLHAIQSQAADRAR